MSMTREEIIKELEKTVAGAEILTSLGYEEVNEYLDIFKVALAALHPVSREQVEKVWRGEWDYPTCEWNLPECPKCGCNSKDAMYGHKNNFCPRCGEAMTDKAVDMVMERLDALKDD